MTKSVSVITSWRRTFWLALTLILFGASYWETTTATIGGWDIHVMGVRHGAVWDPGGPYLGSGLMLFDDRYAPFVGHPGLPLMALCQLVGRILWLPSMQVPFDLFCAQHLQTIAMTAMLAMTAAFVGALLILECVALRLLGSPGQAMLAVLAYATTYPFLFYLNRISPEPLLVIFTLSAFLCLWRYYEIGEHRRRWWWLALSAQAAVAAVYTKFMIAGPLVFFIPLQIACRRDLTLAKRLRDAAAFLGLSVPLFLAGTWKIDWSYFFQFWFAYAPGVPRYSTSDTWVVNVVRNLSVTLPAMLGSAASQLSPTRLLPSFATREGLFFAAEGLLLVLSAIGLAAWFKASTNRPVLLRWFLAYLAITVIPYLQKGIGDWHYLFVHLAVASVFAAYAIARGLHTLRRCDVDRVQDWCGAALVAVAVNGCAIYIAADMRRYDAEQARFWQLYYEAPSLIDADAHVGLIGAPHVAELLQPVGAYLPATSFVERFRDFLVPIAGDESAAELRRRKIQATVELTDRGLVLRTVERAESSTDAP